MALALNFPLNSLRAFEAAGRHCHVRRAADELCVTHAAVSRQIRNLEERIGTALFTRDGNRMVRSAALSAMAGLLLAT